MSVSPFATLAAYRELSKSGIVALVLISVLAGYLVGHPLEAALDLPRLAFTILGILFLASGSSALNQLQERSLDSLMPRTAKRPLPTGRISVPSARAYIAVTLTLGLAILGVLSLKVALLGILAVAIYNGLYTLWWKPRLAYAAVPGAIPGALPALMGSVAANSELFHPAGLYLFAVVFYWQMPHFWVLALRFREDYRLGGIPTLPVRHGPGVTIFHVTLWTLGYVALALLSPFFLTGAGVITLLTAILCSLKLLWELRVFAGSAPGGWLRYFLWINFSLILLLGAATLDAWAPHLLVSLRLVSLWPASLSWL
ncbi:MAG: protoheme IX farnesyltransferase [Oligoflexia bacterium]|nr:protoheme IX farnesyltransferase [Oligoflexia bacterium]